MGSTTKTTEYIDNTTEASMPKFQEDYIRNVVLPKATEIGNAEYDPYSGDRVAGMNPLEEKAMLGYGELDMGTDAYLAAGDVYSGLAGRTPQDQAAQIAQYQNQFTSGVIDPTMAAMERQRGKDIVGEQGQITGANAFGNSRRDVFQGERAGEYDARMGQTLAQLNQQGLQYGTGRAAAEDQLRMQAAGSMAGNAGSALKSTMAGLGSQLTAGSVGRGMDQAELDAAYEEYLMSMQYPLTQLTALQGGAASIPAGFGTTNVSGTTMGTRSASGAGNTLAALGSFGQGLGAMGYGPQPGCWVAREVYGVHDPRWTEFREWMFTKSPDWFRNTYMKYGERAAAVVKRLPFLKAIIRPLMDAKRKSLGYK